MSHGNESPEHICALVGPMFSPSPYHFVGNFMILIHTRWGPQCLETIGKCGFNWMYSWFMIAKLVQITVLFLGFIKQLTYLGGPHGMAIWMGYHQTWRFQLRKWKGKCTYIFGWFIIFLVYIFNGIFRILNWRYLPLPTIYKAYVRPMTM
jgi:hypothetical protein